MVWQEKWGPLEIDLIPNQEKENGIWPLMRAC